MINNILQFKDNKMFAPSWTGFIYCGDIKNIKKLLEKSDPMMGLLTECLCLSQAYTVQGIQPVVHIKSQYVIIMYDGDHSLRETTDDTLMDRSLHVCFPLSHIVNGSIKRQNLTITYKVDGVQKVEWTSRQQANKRLMELTKWT